MSFLAKAALIVAVVLTPAAQMRDRRVAVDANAGVISGRVEVETDRQRGPVRRAAVTLTRDDGAVNRTTGTDADGQYRFVGIPDGSYRVRVQKPGFVAEPINIRTTGVGPGAVTANIEMQRAGAIEGRFLDSRGDPIVKLSVTADRWPMLPDERTSEPAHSAVTDDLGRFRVHTLPPGRYRVHATPPPPASVERFFFPGTTNPAEAQILTVASGQTLDRLDLIVPVPPLATDATQALAAIERELPVNPFFARISGRVTRSDTGQPMPNANVLLASQPGTTPNIRRGARTDTSGRFEFGRLSAGSYALAAMASGFLSEDPRGPGRVIAVKAGERIEGADVVLVAASAIEAFVVDQFGDPAPGVRLHVTERRYVSGVPRFVPVATSVGFRMPDPTDDRGWFRASGLLPGDYYLIALPEPFGRSGRADFATTYFPGAASADAATPVHVTAGIDALDLRFGLVGSRTAAIAGIATDADGRPAAKSQVLLVQIYDGEVRAMVSAPATVGTDGSFVFPEVPEGTYVLQGMAPGLFGSRDVTISRESDSLAPPITLTLRPMVRLRGRIVFEGDATPARPTTLGSGAVVVQPTDFTSGPVIGQGIAFKISADWSFEIADLAWHGVVRASTSSEWTLARVMLQGRNITDTPFDFQSADVNGLEVVLTNRVGTVAGTVVSGNQPVPDAAVIVFGADNTTWTYFSRTLRSGRTDAQGAFTLPGLLPGRYLAVAMPARNPSIDVNSVTALRSVATPFVVAEGATAPLTLTIVR